MKYIIVLTVIFVVFLLFRTDSNKTQRIETSLISIDLPVNFRIVDTSDVYAIFEHGLMQKKRLSVTKENLNSEVEIIDGFIQNMINGMHGYEFETSDMYLSHFWGDFRSSKTFKIQKRLYTYEFTVIALRQEKTWYLIVVSSVFADHGLYFDSIAKLDVVLKN